MPSALLPLPALGCSAHHESKVEEEHDWRHEHQHGAQLELGVRVEGEQGKGGGQGDGKLQQVGDDEADELQEAAEPDGEGLRCTGGAARRSEVSLGRRSVERADCRQLAWQRVGNRVCRWWSGAGTAAARLTHTQQPTLYTHMVNHTAHPLTLPFTTPPCAWL